MANPEEVYHEYGIKPLTNLNDVQNGSLNNGPIEKTNEQQSEKTKKQNHKKTLYDAIVLGVAHNEFLNMDLNALKKDVSVVYDVKGVLVSGVDAKL